VFVYQAHVRYRHKGVIEVFGAVGATLCGRPLCAVACPVDYPPIRHITSHREVVLLEQRAASSEQRTANSEQRTANSEQRTANSEQRTAIDL
jgi:Na+-translocating ferredoxin:NAD+ oxidoreductase RnfC subunit